MEDELESIGRISDVSYLTTRLRLAKRKKETQTIDAILQRLKSIGVLKDEQKFEERVHKNLRDYIHATLEGPE